MEGKRYEYILEPAEIREFYCKAMLAQAKSRQKIWIVVSLLLLADVFLLSEGAGFLVIMLAVLFLASGVRSYVAIRKQLAGQAWTVWLENGRLKSVRNDYADIPCENIQFIRITRRLLMLGYLQTPGRPAWYVMPLRVFSGVQEREAFLNQFRSPQPVFGAEGEPAEERQAYLRLSYMMHAEKWVHFYKGAVSLIHAGTFGKRERILGMVLLGSFLMVVMTACVTFMSGGFYWVTVVFSLLVTVMLILRIFFRDPEKALRKQIQTPVMANRACGLWQISFFEEGVMVEQPGGMKSLYAWKNLGWLVETEAVFYLFSKDKRRFIMVSKESFLNWDQVGIFLRLCETKGLEKRPPKRMRYVPGWAVLVMFVAAYAILLGSIFARRIFMEFADEAEEGQTAYESDAWTPGGSSDYVPIERQAEVLRSLGLSVPEEWVETTRAYMEEYEMQEWVEGMPYTWLLMDMGAPDYDEESMTLVYADEVFWFDFEGFDLSTDYIDVLQGMLALSEGSCLDRVTDIREDTEKVDWERGRGTVTVSLSWDGREYRWDMKAYNDWIDSDVLGMLNTLLKQADSQEFFYVTGDNGQGAIVFFCTEEWAQEFTEATGLMLESVFTSPD